MSAKRLSRHNLSLDKLDELIKTISLLAFRKLKLIYPCMIRCLKAWEKVNRVFPVRKVLSEAVSREWKEPERAQFFSKFLKHMFPYEEDESHVWNKRP